MSDIKEVQPVTGLTPLELACLTARVPASGNPVVDGLITQGLRFQTANDYLIRAILHHREGTQDAFERRASTGKLIADILLKQFQGSK